MQKNVQSLLLIHRENYNVPNGEEHEVHCKLAKLAGDGSFIERPHLVKYGVKKFETSIKENLESMGYTVEILYHPNRKYGNVVIKDKDVEIAMKDAEIVRLREQLEALQAEQPAVADGEKKKGGRPKKEVENAE